MRDLEYIADSIMLERYMPRPAGLPIQKEAGVKEIFNWIGDQIGNLVNNIWEPSKSTLENVAGIALDGIIGMFTPWWVSLIYFICKDILQVDLGSIFTTVKDGLLSIWKANGKVTTKDVNTATNAAIGGDSNGAVDHVTAKLESEVVFKIAAEVISQAQNSMKQYSIVVNAGIFNEALYLLLKPFKSLFSPPVAKTIIGKILKFIFKSVLISAATRAAAGAVKSVAGPAIDGAKSMFSGSTSTLFQHASDKLKKNESFGTERTPDEWTEKFSFHNLQDELIKWTTQRYPQLQGHEDAIKKSSVFNTVVSKILTNNINNHWENLTTFPHEILPGAKSVWSKAELVDLYIDDVVNHLPPGIV